MGTSTPFGPDFVKELIPWMLQIFDDATKRAYHMMWDILINFLTEHWLLVIGVLTFFLILAVVEYFTTGHWAMLGRVLYSYIYYGILFLIGLIFGPEIFANDWIDLLLFTVYVVSFIWVGMILNKTGIRRR